MFELECWLELGFAGEFLVGNFSFFLIVPLAILSNSTDFDLNPPSSMLCWCFTDSRCLARFAAFSKVNFGSSCNLSERSRFRSPTTMRSRINSSFNATKIAVPRKAIQICDEAVNRFPLSLDSGIEFCSLEDYISFHNEVVLKFAFYLIVIIFFFGCELK